MEMNVTGGAPLRIATHDMATRVAREFSVLTTTLHVVVAAASLCVMILALRWSVPFPAALAGLALALAGYGYLTGSFPKLWRPSPPFQVLVHSGLLSTTSVLLIRHATQTEVVLLICILMVVATLVSLCLYLAPRLALAMQTILFLPSGLALLLSAERSNMFLAGMIVLVCVMLHLMLRGLTSLMCAYVERTDRFEAVAQKALSDLEEVLGFLHPHTLTIDKSGKVVTASKQLGNLLGWPASSFAGQKLATILDTHHQTTSVQMIGIERLLREGTPFEADGIALTSSCGDSPIFKMTAVPLTSTSGEQAHIRLVLELSEDDPHLTGATAALARDISHVIDGAVWEFSINEKLRVITNGDDALNDLMERMLSTDDDETSTIKDAMTHKHPFNIMLGPLPDGRLVRCLGAPRFDRDGMYLGYRGVLSYHLVAEQGAPPTTAETDPPPLMI